jgi:hypothetical protein
MPAPRPVFEQGERQAVGEHRYSGGTHGCLGRVYQSGEQHSQHGADHRGRPGLLTTGGRHPLGARPARKSDTKPCSAAPVGLWVGGQVDMPSRQNWMAAATSSLSA